MLLVLLLAAGMRIYHLNLQGLWGDEGWSVEFSDPQRPTEITQRLVTDLHPPLYFIGLGWWRNMAGDSEIAMRVLAVFAALLTVAMIGRIGRQLFSPSAGIMAALVLALADKHIVLSQEVRHYPLAFMWMALSSLIFLDWLKSPKRRNSLVYALVIIAGLYTHYYTALILVVQLVYGVFFLETWRQVGKLLLLIGAASLAFVPWAFVAIYQLQIRPEGILHSMSRSWDTLSFLTVDFLGRPVVLLGGLLLLGLPFWSRKNTRYTPNSEWYAVLWFGLPILISIVIYPVVSVLTDRNMALVLLPMALLVGHGVSRFQAPAQYFLAALIAINGVTSLDSYFEHPPSREMAAYISQNYPLGEPVVMDVGGEDKALRYHLREVLPQDTQIVSLHQWRIDYGVYFLGVLGQLLEDNDGFWVAYWVNEDKAWDLPPMLAQYGYIQSASQRFYHLDYPIDLYHYDRLPALDEALAVYDGQIRLHRVKSPTMLPLGQTLEVSLWWSSEHTLTESYSVSVFLLDDAGRLAGGAQHDGPPQNGAAPTNTWQVDEIILDSHAIPTQGLASGTYRVAIKVYNSMDGFILPVEQVGSREVAEYFIAGTINIQ